MRNLKNRKGFTLVELLIVVAIIGVLSTVGIPAFRRMVQKAKQSEAKINLAALYTAQTGFFSEYGAYGNNLTGVGFVMDGGTIYGVGFPSATCASVNANITPDISAVAIRTNICNTNLSYYIGATAVNCVSTNAAAANFLVGAARTGGTDVCLLSVMPGDGSSFTASATGPIAPGIQTTSALAVPGTPGQDAWSINQTKVLANNNNGIN